MKITTLAAIIYILFFGAIITAIFITKSFMPLALILFAPSVSHKDEKDDDESI